MHGLSECVVRSAAQWPDRPCLVLGGMSWTYSQLIAAQEEVATTLREAGVESSRIALLGEKSFGMFAALLGVLNVRSAYVPLNSMEPSVRLRRQLRSSSAAVVISALAQRERLSEALQEPDLKFREMRVGQEILLLGDLREFHEVHSGRDGAYAMYTSGSTGAPKLVDISQSNAAAFLDAFSSVFPVSPSDRVLQLADLSFDFSVGEIFPTWLGGGAIVCPVGRERLNLALFCEHHAVTIWNSVPTVAASMISMRAIPSQTTLQRVRRSIFCGETLPVHVADAWRQVSERGEILNVYGPTESTVFATWFRYTGLLPPDIRSVPIGVPLPGMKAELSRQDNAEPEVGELLLAGPQVAEACILREGSWAGWYRTGDEVRCSDEHGFVFLGRMDQQIKVAGCRIDLIEVELHIRDLVEGRQTAVVPINAKHNLGTELVAFVEGQVPQQDLRRSCADSLPKYMVPSRFVYVDALPRTATGKIDRRQLASMAQ